MKIQKWFKENTEDLTGKTIALTGTTGQLADILINYIAERNANIICLNRSKEKTDQQIKKLKLLHPNLKIEFIECDLADFESVKNATKILKQKNIDILYLAAGAYNIKRYSTSLGYDNVFQINFISHYYLAKELSKQIKANNGKIIAVSSVAYNYSKIDENNIDFSSKKKHSFVYGNAKRFLTFSLMELAKEKQINLSIVHPGITLTEMTNHYPKAINWLVKIAIKLFFPNNKKAALSLLKGIFENTNYLEWIGPKHLTIWGNPKKQYLKNIKQTEIKKIYDIAERIYKDIKKDTN